MTMKPEGITPLLIATLLLTGSIAIAAPQPEHGNAHNPASATETGSPYADVNRQRECSQCGMDRKTFAHSRILVTYEDGSAVGTCSIACLVTELKTNRGKTVRSIQVGDYTSKKLIDATQAVWVIGGSKRGVMTRTAKWAFSRKADAEAFVSTCGGKIADYPEAYRQAEAEQAN
jgi:nitrous oxide reductase accessory protein NosL